MQTSNNERHDAHMQRAHSLRMNGKPGHALKHEVHANMHYMGFGGRGPSSRETARPLKLKRIEEGKTRYMSLCILNRVDIRDSDQHMYTAGVIEGGGLFLKESELLLNVNRHGKADLKYYIEEFAPDYRTSDTRGDMWEFVLPPKTSPKRYLAYYGVETIQINDLPIKPSPYFTAWSQTQKGNEEVRFELEVVGMKESVPSIVGMKEGVPIMVRYFPDSGIVCKVHKWLLREQDQGAWQGPDLLLSLDPNQSETIRIGVVSYHQGHLSPLDNSRLQGPDNGNFLLDKSADEITDVMNSLRKGPEMEWHQSRFTPKGVIPKWRYRDPLLQQSDDAVRGVGPAKTDVNPNPKFPFDWRYRNGPEAEVPMQL